MKFFGIHILQADETLEENEEDDIPQFKPFDSTYKFITWIMTFAMMYPNVKTDKWRLISIPIVSATALPFIVFTILDIYHLFMEKDLANLIRISTVVGPFTAGIIKVVLLYYKRQEAEIIINEFERDYLIANTASRRVRKAVHENIKANLFYERLWTTCVFITVCIFPLQAAVMNMYSNMTEDENRHMITEFSIPYVEHDEEFSSPFFEIMFAYTFYCCILYFLHFSAYDAFIMVSIGHACLKFELFTIALEDAILVQDEEKRRQMLSNIIREQNRAIWFMNVVEETFQFWLGLAIVAVLVQICCCLFYIMEGFGFDERYSIFTTATIIYIYLICSRAHQLKTAGEMTPLRMYCCGWETVEDQDLWKILPFMIARFQQTFELRAFQFFVYDLELFVYIVKTAYSMFTLLKNT